MKDKKNQRSRKIRCGIDGTYFRVVGWGNPYVWIGGKDDRCLGWMDKRQVDALIREWAKRTKEEEK